MRAYGLLMAALALLAAPPAASLTYVPATDAELVDDAAKVVAGRVVSVRETPTHRYLTVAIDGTLKGSAGATVTVKQVGGTEWFVPGAPQAVLGDRGVWFLNASGNADPALGWMKGVGANYLSIEGQARQAERFRAWVVDRAAGRTRPADYRPVGPFTFVRQYVLWRNDCEDGGPARVLRWRTHPTWSANSMELSGTEGSVGWSDLVSAASRWEAVSTASVRLARTTEKATREGDVIRVPTAMHISDTGLGIDPLDSGGSRTAGVTWVKCGTFYDAGALGAAHEPSAVYVTLVSNLLDYFSPADWRGVMVHELGHTLGLDHPADRSAIMYARFRSGRGDNLGDDDIVGIRALYGIGGSDGGGGSGDGASGGDRRPQPVGVLEDRRLALGGALTLDLSLSFRSRDGSDLTFTATSSEPSVATASVDGSTLTLRGLSEGGAQITVNARGSGGNSLNRRFRVKVASLPAAWYLPPASHLALQGVVRVVNHSDQAGEVTVKATDDAGMAYGPLTLAVDAHAATHFNSHDLENGNAAKGLTGMTGPGTGGWRLAFESDTLDVEALGYARTSDGFVTAMSATAAKAADGALRLATFNPASNTNQVSVLRLVNPSDLEALATVTGTDDSGSSPGSPVSLTVPPNAACEVDAMELESGKGLACGEPQAGLGDGAGKWRLSIASDAPLVAMGLLRSPTGHLSNLSGAAMAAPDGTWHAPLFPSASDPDGRQGIVRVASGSNRAGSVRIRAFDDNDADFGRLSLNLGAGEAKQFSSHDLELGNRDKGLVGRTGSGTGAWHLALSGATSVIDFTASAYVRHWDGFLIAMQAVAPSMAVESPSTGRVHRIVIFNPGSNTRQVSVLRLVNQGSETTTATVTGADDRGVRSDGSVELSVPAGSSVELTATELESGMAEAIESGALGDGAGKWRLRVASEGDLAVMSLLRSPTGHLTNLSGADEGRVSALPSLLPPSAWVRAEDAGGRRVRAEWASVPGARYGVELLLDGEPIRSLKATARTDFRWSGLEPGIYTVRVRSVDADGKAGPWGDPSNEVAVR